MTIPFLIANVLIVPFWLLMIFLPLWSITRRMMESPFVALPAALVYVVLFLPRLPHDLPILMTASLPRTEMLLGSPPGATMAWAHLLAFDLLVGRWIYLDSRVRGISPWLMAPVLFFSLYTGPLGFTLYLVVRALTGRAQTLSALGAPDSGTTKG